MQPVDGPEGTTLFDRRCYTQKDGALRGYVTGNVVTYPGVPVLIV